MTSTYRFNPPPGWPPVAPGWTPAPDWKPDPSWPPAPAGWQLWVPNTPKAKGSWFGRHKILTAVGGLVVLIVVIAAATSGGGSKTAPAASSNTPAAAKPPPVKAAPKGARIGQAVRDGKFEFTVTRVQPGIARVGTADLGQAAQGQFVFVYVTVRNIGGQAQTFDGSSQYLYDRADRKYDADSAAAVYLDSSKSFLNDINPGNAVSGIVVFDVPKATVPVRAELHDSPFSVGAKVALR